MKWVLGIVLFLVATAAALYFVRLNQIKKFKASYIPAKHETQQSILDFAKQQNILGELLVAKDTIGYEKVFRLFAPGTIFIFDSKMNIVDINYGNYKGSCYFDIANYICDDFNFSHSKYNHKITDTTFVSDLKTSTTFITNFTWQQTQGYDYIVVFCWAKWMTSSYINEGAVQKITDCVMKNTKRKILLMSVSSDCVAPWYPVDAELPATQ